MGTLNFPYIWVCECAWNVAHTVSNLITYDGFPSRKNPDIIVIIVVNMNFIYLLIDLLPENELLQPLKSQALEDEFWNSCTNKEEWIFGHLGTFVPSEWRISPSEWQDTSTVMDKTWHVFFTVLVVVMGAIKWGNVSKIELIYIIGIWNPIECIAFDLILLYLMHNNT